MQLTAEILAAASAQASAICRCGRRHRNCVQWSGNLASPTRETDLTHLTAPHNSASFSILGHAEHAGRPLASWRATIRCVLMSDVMKNASALHK